MKEILACDECLRIVADSQPDLGAMPLIQIVRRSGAAHLGRNPPRLKSVRKNVRPTACHCKCQQDAVQLAIRISLRPPPWPLLPREILQAVVAVLVESRTQVHQTLRSLNQSCQNVRRQCVDGKYMWQTILSRHAPGFLISNRGVMNHSIEPAQLIHLLRHGAGLRDARQVPNDYHFGAGYGCNGLFASLLIPRVQDRTVPLLDKKLRGHSPQPVRRTGNEYSCHGSPRELETFAQDRGQNYSRPFGISCSMSGRRRLYLLIAL